MSSLPLGSRIPARCDDECPVTFMVGQVSGQVRECLAAKGPAVLKLGPVTRVIDNTLQCLLDVIVFNRWSVLVLVEDY